MCYCALMASKTKLRDKNNIFLHKYGLCLFHWQFVEVGMVGDCAQFLKHPGVPTNFAQLDWAWPESQFTISYTPKTHWSYNHFYFIWTKKIKVWVCLY